MKHLFSLLLMLVTATALAGQTPFGDQLEAALNFNGGNLGVSSKSIGLEKVARVQYSVGTDGGTSSATVKSLGVTLPPNAMVKGFYGYIDSAFNAGAGTARMRLDCGSVDIDPQRNLSALAKGAMFSGTTGVDCGASGSALGVILTDGTATQGAVTYFINYVIHNP